jgi:hypothetical protein
LPERNEGAANAESCLRKHRRIFGETARGEKKGEPIQHQMQHQDDEEETDPQQQRFESPPPAEEFLNDAGRPGDRAGLSADGEPPAGQEADQCRHN